MKLDPDTQALLQALAARLGPHARSDGELDTAVPGIKVYRATQTVVVQRGMLRPSLCVVAQGHKVARAGADTELRYGAGNFIASSIDMPMAGHAVAVSPARPFLAIAFELMPHDVLSVLRELELPVEASSSAAPVAPAAYVGTCDAKLLDVVLRAAVSLDDPREARFLAPMLRRELVYRLVTGPSALAVYHSALVSRPDDGVGHAVDWLKRHFKQPLKIDQLARLSNMSTSSLQHKFKAAVMMAPLQYQKRLRLEEARRLLLSGLADATSAAFEVGYESPSQFIREYRRLFGLPPLRDVKQVRRSAASRARTGDKHI